MNYKRWAFYSFLAFIVTFIAMPFLLVPPTIKWVVSGVLITITVIFSVLDKSSPISRKGKKGG